MTGHLFANDKLGLTGRWYEVPKTKELPSHYGLAAREVRKLLGRDADIRIEQNQRENRRARSGFPYKRQQDGDSK